MAWSPPPLAAQIVLGFIFGSLALIGFTGNVLVCIAIYTNKRLRKKENLYFVSLAGADLLLSVLVMPFAALNDVMGHWLFGEYCKIWMSLDIMCCTCSILHLCAISFDRYYHINDPLLYSERMTGRKIFTAILAVWTLSSAIAFVPLIFETHFDKALSVFWVNSSGHVDDTTPSTNKARKLYQCMFNLQPIYAIVSSLVSFYIPSVIMIVAYGKLYRYAQRHAQTIRHQMKAAASSLLNVSSTDLQQAQASAHLHVSNHMKPVKKRRGCRCRLPAPSNLTVNGNHATLKRRELISSDSKARVTLGAIVGTFLFSWFPFFVCNIIRAFCETCVPDWLFLMLTWMGYANSAQNPIIYSIFNRDFRYAFKKILHCPNRSKGSSGGGGSVTGYTGTAGEDLVVVNGHATALKKNAPHVCPGSTAV